jgi:hypothetical protein
VTPRTLWQNPTPGSARFAAPFFAHHPVVVQPPRPERGSAWIRCGWSCASDRTAGNSLKKLRRDQRALKEKERQIADAERRLRQQVGGLLSSIGYRLVATNADTTAQTVRGKRTRALPKNVKCPKCDRRFSHPLPMARHMSATHPRKWRKRGQRS